MAKTLKDFISTSLILLIRIYRYTFSLLFGNCCRFEPSCSAYAIRAIQLHGSFKGILLIARRLLRCHPWCPGGIDLVPNLMKSKK